MSLSTNYQHKNTKSATAVETQLLKLGRENPIHYRCAINCKQEWQHGTVQSRVKAAPNPRSGGRRAANMGAPLFTLLLLL